MPGTAMNNLKDVLDAVGNTADFYFAGISDPNQRNLLGDTPLHVVSRWGDAEAARILIQAGAEVNVQGEHGMTPLIAAIEKGSLALVELLLNSGADPFIAATDGGRRLEPLYFARLDTSNDERRKIVGLLEKVYGRE